MKKLTLIVCLCISFMANAQEILPNSTDCFDKNGEKALYIDYYNAAPPPQSDTTYMGKAKPAIIFIFGGGFIGGERNKPVYLPWFKKLTREGYKVFSIDYRLGLIGKKVTGGISSFSVVRQAADLGVEDLFKATDYIIRNKDKYHINPDNLIVSGSSAGAIIALQAEYYISNSDDLSKLLPQNFNYKGVISFAGAIMSNRGKLKYKKEPCPTLLFHGTSDKIVAYNQIKFFNLGFFGTSKITERLEKFNFNYNTLRYKDRGHEIAESMLYSIPEQLRFIETNVIMGEKRICDQMIDDPAIPVSKLYELKDLYK